MKIEDLRVGDIVIKDSQKGGAKMVKFLMTAPTIWHHIYRAIRGTQEEVKYYHPAMIGQTLSGKLTGIEQNWKVEFEDVAKLIGGDSRMLIARRVGITHQDRVNLAEESYYDLGQKWGVVHTLFGKFPTWLTGIKFFARYCKLPNEEICVGRVAKWHYHAFKETFGCKRYTEVTTHIMAKYILSHPEKYVILESRG